MIKNDLQICMNFLSMNYSNQQEVRKQNELNRICHEIPFYNDLL